MANVETFEHDGKTYTVRLPNSKEREEGERIYNRVFKYALDTGCLLDGQVMKVAREHGLWTEEDEAKQKARYKELEEKQRILDEGGIELEEAHKIALSMRQLRNEILVANYMLEELRSQGVSRKAESSRIDYYVACCTLDDKGRRVFKDLDEFYTQQGEDLAQLAQLFFNKLWYNYNEDMFKFPEEEFIREYGLADEAPKKKERKPFLKDGKPVEPKVQPEEVAQATE